MKGLTQLLTSLGVNAVPAVGWFFEGWSSGTTLATYWFENVVAGLFMTLKIVIHRRLAPCRGHFRYAARDEVKGTTRKNFLIHFLSTNLIFSAVHGIFLLIIITALTAKGKGGIAGLDYRSLAVGCGIVLVLLVVDFLIDLPGLGNKTFFWLEQKANANLARVIVIHLVILFGMVAVVITGSGNGIFAVFVFLKTLTDLTSVLPRWDPDEPPFWVSRIMGKAPVAYPGMTFAEFWRKDKAKEIARRHKNETKSRPKKRR